MSSSGMNFSIFHNIINGKAQATSATRHVLNPSTLEANPEAPVSTLSDVDEAVTAAQKVLSAWAAVPLAERQQAVKKLADSLEAKIAEFAPLLVKEQGKPMSMAQMEIMNSVQILRGLADVPFQCEVDHTDGRSRTVVRYLPLGVAVGIIPWNFPIYLACFKIGSALITGNTIIIKPSPFTPYCDLKLVEMGQEFFPPGVLQVLSGDDNLGPWLTSHPGVSKVSFTGSIATGKRVMESCSKTLKRVTLELGGNDAAIVCDDVDLAAVAPQIATFSFVNSGQICIAIKRVYVHESIYPQFIGALNAVIQALPVGDGFAEGAFMGPLQNQLQYDRVQDLLEDINKNGLKIANPETASAAKQGPGYFIQPTVVEDPPETSRIVKEEPFGPLLPILKWKDEDDVIQRANDVDVGLGASVWTKDLKRAERIAKRLEAGTVWVNKHADLQARYPFGGHKQSGIGVELGTEGLKAYCNVQTLHLG